MSGNLQAASDLIGNSAPVIVHLDDGETSTGEPFAVDVAGIALEYPGGGRTFFPWSSVQRVNYTV